MPRFTRRERERVTKNLTTQFCAFGDSESEVVKAGQPLLEQGKTVSGKGGRTVFNGPFAESKEAIGGYLLLRVDDLEGAVEIAKGHPALEYGMTIEIREVASECRVFQRVREQLAHAIV